MRILGLLFSATTCIAGEFVNLTFDEPDLTGWLTPIDPGGPLEGNTSEILRAWTVTVNGNALTRMTYAPEGTGSAGLVTLLENPAADKQTVLGSHTLLLYSPFASTPEIRVRQTGTIPAETTGLWIGSAGYIEGFVNGIKIGEVKPELGSQAVLDVTRFAGQEVSLEFVLRYGGSARFDIFGFTPIPEPSTWALCGVGGIVLLCLGKRRIR